MKTSLLVALVVTQGVGTSAWAMGRRGTDDETIYDTRPVPRGSPANPNPAFSPPRFDEELPPTSNAPTPLRRESAPAQPSTARPVNSSESPAAAPQTNTPPPAVKQMPQSDTYEPPLPEYSGDEAPTKGSSSLPASK